MSVSSILSRAKSKQMMQMNREKTRFSIFISLLHISDVWCKPGEWGILAIVPHTWKWSKVVEKCLGNNNTSQK
jgi:hypothetical protein